VDIGLYYGTMPPIIVPLSDRAREKMGLEEACLGAMFLEDAAEDVLASIAEEDWLVCELEDLPYGDLINLMNIKLLH